MKNAERPEFLKKTKPSPGTEEAKHEKVPPGQKKSTVIKGLESIKEHLSIGDLSQEWKKLVKKLKGNDLSEKERKELMDKIEKLNDRISEHGKEIVGRAREVCEESHSTDEGPSELEALRTKLQKSIITLKKGDLSNKERKELVGEIMELHDQVRKYAERTLLKTG